MGVSSAVNRNDYTGNGGLSSYDYDFRIFEETDLEVTVRDPDGLETLLVLGTDYEVNDVGETPGGDIDLVDNDQAWLTSGNLTTGWHLTLRRVMPIVQDTDIRNQGPYYPDVIEDQFDKLVMIDQQQQDEIDRSVKVPATEDTEMILPSVEERAGQLAGWDADGDFIPVSAGINTALVTPFMETLLDDANAATARTTLGAQQETSALTALTAPAIDDSLPIYDLSATANKKITPDNLLKVIALFTEHTAPAALDTGLVYDAAASAAKKVFLAGMAAGSKRIGVFNLGLAAAQTSVANDSIKIQGAAAALAASNPAFLNAPSSASAGLLSTFRVAANVTILLTGLKSSRDTFGNFTDIPIAVYAINDGETLKWGVSEKPNMTTITSANSSSTPSSVNAYSKMLVNSALVASTCPCMQVGWFLADFTDAGDVWAVQTGAGEIQVGMPFPAPSGDTVAHTGNGHGSTNTAIRRFTTAEDTTDKSIKYTDSATNGASFTILEDGTYGMSYSDVRSAGALLMGISANSNQLTTSIATITAAHRKAYTTEASTVFGFAAAQVRLSAGDVVRPHDDGNADGSAATARFSIKKLAHA